ncbi:FKBP-type peptidyl-prolyl cis-trans isomerase (trigger factor) [Lachnospiraceae bacterium YSD2013]|nr:FKBP-type peptidyl-prolyl cis-trans isomerase (trigger factor) [Lachnospiraceae bacterium YSD2013]
MSEEIKEKVEEVSESSISKSKAKRQARAAEVKAAKVKKNFDAILGWVIGILLAVAVIGIIAAGMYQHFTTTVSDSNYSAGLTDEGFVKDADLSSVTDLGLVGMEIPFSEVEFSDETVESQINSDLQQHGFYSDDATATVKDGSAINLDYSGSIDGVQFDGGTAENQVLTIGSGQFIDNFEEQLIGSHPGDNVTVTVTFPDPYENNPDLAGKEAVFECKVNSIWTLPELDDEYVKTNHSDIADNVADFKAYIKDQGYKSNLDTYISNYVTENASASKIPSSYRNHLKQLLKYSDEQSFEQYKTYMTYYGYSDAASMSFSDYTQKSSSEYEKDLKERAVKQASMDLTYESIFKSAGLSIDDEDYKMILEYYGGEEQALSTYGQSYVNQTAIKYAVIKYIRENAKVVEGATE